MSGIRTRADLKSLADTNLASGTGAISAVNHREVVKSGSDSALQLGDAEVIVISMALTAPPGSEADRDSYVVAAGATGDWAGQDFNIATFDNSISPAAWFFTAAVDGMAVWNKADDTQYRWNAGISPEAWQPPIGQHTAIGAETVTGYITITDSDGVSRKIAVVS